MFNRSVLALGIVLVSLSFSVSTSAASAPPTDYSPITWASSPGIKTYFKTYPNAGYADFLTVIDLSINRIQLVTSNTPKVYESPGVAPFESDDANNWLFPRASAELLKANNPDAKFIWTGQFFNTNMATTVLSLAVKSEDMDGTYISTGGRPSNDMAERRRMLIIDNETGVANVTDFDHTQFTTAGDFAIEGFHPLGSPSSKRAQASRVYIGIRNNGSELVIYCSRSANKEEASAALLAAGILEERQMQVDGGGSAMCAYNLPGQYFVEPVRSLPHVVAAFPSFEKRIVDTNRLNVRVGAGASYTKTRQVLRGEEVTVFEEVDGWVRIGEGEWVSGRYLR